MKTVLELGTREVVCCTRKTSVLEAAGMMRHANVGTVVVVDNVGKGKVPVGMLTDRDVVYEIVALDLDAADIAAGDMMSPELYTVKQDADAFTALKLMAAEGVRRVPVVDRDGILVGIFALDDALEQVTNELENILVLIKGQRRPGARTRAA